jgi:hypothetical protein
LVLVNCGVATVVPSTAIVIARLAVVPLGPAAFSAW